MLARVMSTLLAVLVLASPAHATVSRTASLEELTRWSVLVLRGRVTSLEGRMHEHRVATEVTFEITDTLRGAANNRIQFLVHGGEVGVERVDVPGEARFVVGEEAIVFLMRGHGVLWLTALAQGKWTIARDQAGVEWVGRSEGHSSHGATRLDAMPYSAFLRELGSSR